MRTLLGSLRHKMVFGDVPSYDATLFSEMFGEEDRFEEVQNEQIISPLQEQPMTRSGSSCTKTIEAIMSPSDIMYQNEFQAAVKIVKHNRPIPVCQIDANFVDDEEFIDAIEQVDSKSGALWLTEKNNYILDNDDVELVKTLTVEPEEETLTAEHVELHNEVEADDNVILKPHLDNPKDYKYKQTRSRIRQSSNQLSSKNINPKKSNNSILVDSDHNVPITKNNKDNDLKTASNIEKMIL